MEGHSVISPDVLGAYAADAACEVEGVVGLVEGQLPRHRGVRVVEDEGSLTVELHLSLAWGVSAPAVGAAVQERVVSYLRRMADVTPSAVDVVIAEIAPPAT
ncbi:MAG: Asp23/Gls24 family envelope stress response protein [Gaiella sp.]